MIGEKADARVLRLNALRIDQRPDVPIFVFGVNGRLLHQFASVQAASRSADGVLEGYQREKVERHIREIYNYLAREGSILPNAVVLGVGSEVAFEPTSGQLRNEWGTPGVLLIPIPWPGEPKSCLVVDGQQRVSALARLDPSRQFPVVVVAFQSSSLDLQREQFVLVNKTKPLPRDLLNELLPHLESDLPTVWRLRRVAAAVVETLRFDRSSPFYGRIRGLGVWGPRSNISQAAVIAVVEASVRRGGVLADHDAPEYRLVDVAAMAEILSVYFRGVARVWATAWDESPRASRLVHGVGITALGRLMDVVMSDVDVAGRRAVSSVERRLRRLEDRCAWTDGRWPRPLDCPWNALQNTSQDKRLLADYLLNEYARTR